MKFFLKSPYPCLVKTDSECVELDENDTLEIESEKLLLVYPLEDATLPFCVQLQPLKESQHYSVVSKSDKQLILLEPQQRLHVSQKEKLNFSGQECNVTISNNKLVFETENRKIEYLCPHNCQKAEIFRHENFACVKFDKHFYAYSIKNNKLSCFNGDVSFENGNLTLVKNFHDSENRQRKAKYNFKEDINLESEEYSHTSTKFSKELVPYKLMESIKAKDFDAARGFLSDNLKEQINNQQIKDFFGNFSNFLPLSTTEFITMSEKHKNYVKFNLINDKIDDITVDEL